MPFIPRCLSHSLLVSLLAVSASLPAWADGMIPETSVVIVKEEDGEASIKVRNSDSSTALLHVTLQDLPEDTEPLLFCRSRSGEWMPARSNWCVSSCVATSRWSPSA